MPSISFSGVGFELETVTQLTASSIRVRFTDDPLRVSRNSAHDALNPVNYTLVGPGTNAISTVSPVNADPQSVDLYLNSQLLAGVWTLTVANIQSISAVPLQSPTQLNFTVAAFALTPPLGQGAKSPSSYDLLRKFFNPGLKGPNWTALLHGLAAGDDIVKNIAVSAFDQLFRSTASTPYLEQLCADYGDSKPPSMGMSDDLFRKLSIVASSYKTVQSTIEAVLEIYYGSTATRASATSATAEPYDFRDGDQLIVGIDRKQTLTVTLHTQDFSQIGQGSAVETAMAITRGFQAFNSRAYALPLVNPLTGGTYVQIFSPSLGLDGSIQVLGGRVQNVLLFPTLVATTQATGTQWTVSTAGLFPGTARFTWSAGTDPSLALVQPGDYANIFGLGFSAANRGAFTVLAVTTTYFDVELPLAVPEVVNTALATDLQFFAPDLQTINGTQRPAYAVTTDILDVVLPTTTEAIVRGPNSAAYLHGNTPLNIASGNRDANGILTVTTTVDHGLDVGNWVELDGLGVDATTAVAPHWTTYTDVIESGSVAACKLADGRVLVAGGGSTDAYIFDPTTNTWSSNVGPMNISRDYASAVLLPSGKVLVAGGSTSDVVTEIFDPATSTWTTTGNLNIHRFQQSMALIPSKNKVLIVGGYGDTSVEFYDIVSGAWTQVFGALSGNRKNGGLVTLADGRLISLGGGPSPLLASVDLYTPANDTWTQGVATLSTARYDFKAIRLATGTSGNVIVIGGTNGTISLSSTEIINPATWGVSAGPSLSVATEAFMADTLLDGRVIVAGGHVEGGFTILDTVQIFNPITSIWSLGPTMNGANSLGAGITLNDGRFLVTGTNADSEVFTPYLGVSASGGVDGLFKVLTTPTLASFTVQQPTHLMTTLLAQGTATSPVPVDNGVMGPFIYDEQNGVAITGIMSMVATEIAAGQSYRTLDVASTIGFPPTGFLCFNFGYDHQLTPVKYLAVLSPTQILLDPTYTFAFTLEVGTTVNYVTQNHPWVPDDPSVTGSLYVTTTAAGREAAEAEVASLVAGGVEYKVTVEYPGDTGLGNSGYPTSGAKKLSDIVRVYAGDNLDQEIPELENS